MNIGRWCLFFSLLSVRASAAVTARRRAVGTSKWHKRLRGPADDSHRVCAQPKCRTAVFRAPVKLGCFWTTSSSHTNFAFHSQEFVILGMAAVLSTNKTSSVSAKDSVIREVTLRRACAGSLLIHSRREQCWPRKILAAFMAAGHLSDDQIQIDCRMCNASSRFPPLGVHSCCHAFSTLFAKASDLSPSLLAHTYPHCNPIPGGRHYGNQLEERTLQRQYVLHFKSSPHGIFLNGVLTL